MEDPSQTSTRSLEGPRKIDVRHTYGARAGSKASFCFVPSGLRLSQHRVDTLLSNEWGLSVPNMIIDVDFGSAHPTLLGTTQLTQLPQFTDWLEQAEQHLNAHSRRSGTGDRQRGGRAAAAWRSAATAATPRRTGGRGAQVAPAPEVQEVVVEELVEGARSTSDAPYSADAPASAGSEASVGSGESLSLINQLIFQKLITIMSSVVDACAMSNSWLLINRCASQSATAELLLELAMERTAQRPTIIVLDSFDRLQQFTSEASRRHAEALRGLQSQATPLGPDDPCKTCDSGAWPYSAQDFVAPEAFVEMDTGPVSTLLLRRRWPRGRHCLRLRFRPVILRRHNVDRPWPGSC